MSILGAHMSIAGGYYKAAERGGEAGCECIQVFTKNNNQWRAKPITDEDVQKFRDAIAEHNIQHTLSHASYLINLGSPKDDLRQKSIDALIVELQRADLLGIPHVVFHPGSYTTSSPEEGLDAIVDSLNQVLLETEDLETFPLLENTAGQGSNLGWDPHHLRQIIDGIEDRERIGVCIDTCHAFAAGMDWRTPDDYAASMQNLDEVFGLHRILAFHLNDSKQPFDSRRDRHEHIGEGEMGLEPFRSLVNDSRFKTIPMYLETEKGERDEKDFDVMNLETLRGLID